MFSLGARLFANLVVYVHSALHNGLQHIRVEEIAVWGTARLGFSVLASTYAHLDAAGLVSGGTWSQARHIPYLSRAYIYHVRSHT